MVVTNYYKTNYGKIMVKWKTVGGHDKLLQDKLRDRSWCNAGRSEIMMNYYKTNYGTNHGAMQDFRRS